MEDVGVFLSLDFEVNLLRYDAYGWDSYLITNI